MLGPDLIELLSEKEVALDMDDMIGDGKSEKLILGDISPGEFDKHVMELYSSEENYYD